jgi:uncharacterized protein YprB with RNaseH-like and TPR domain
MKKTEIEWLWRHRCKAHRHRYLSHYGCYLKECGIPEKVGFLDLECQHLKANIGILYSWCIKPLGQEIKWGLLRKADLRQDEPDGRIVKTCIAALYGFDRIVVYYGKDRRMDIPFIRTRAEICGLDFPEYGDLKITDMYDVAKNKLSQNRYRQDTVCRTILGETEKTYIDWKHWRRAGTGDKESLNYILEHNKADVRDLEKLYKRLIKYVRRSNTSI